MGTPQRTGSAAPRKHLVELTDAQALAAFDRFVQRRDPARDLAAGGRARSWCHPVA